MQKPFLNFILFLVLFSGAGNASAQVSGYRLQKADSLFSAKRYTQALQQYEGIVDNREYTPALLLKMAYIHEALGRIAKTQYFLSLYYESTHDHSALEKMSELAKKNNLEGYEFSDQDRLLNFYYQHSKHITLILIGLMVLMSALAFSTRRRTGKRPIPAFSVLVLLTLLMVFHLEQSKHQVTSIVMRSNTYLMSGPSAGADVVAILEEGHRMSISGKKDVWVKVRWRDQDAYLKEGSLQEVSL
jgi:hypothetical protein